MYSECVVGVQGVCRKRHRQVGQVQVYEVAQVDEPAVVALATEESTVIDLSK